MITNPTDSRCKKTLAAVTGDELCPFLLNARKDAKSETWHLSSAVFNHNHPGKEPEQVRQLTRNKDRRPEIESYVKELVAGNVHGDKVRTQPDCNMSSMWAHRSVWVVNT
jgi:hypothetical protein